MEKLFPIYQNQIGKYFFQIKWEKSLSFFDTFFLESESKNMLLLQTI